MTKGENAEAWLEPKDWPQRLRPSEYYSRKAGLNSAHGNGLRYRQKKSIGRTSADVGSYVVGTDAQRDSQSLTPLSPNPLPNLPEPFPRPFPALPDDGRLAVRAAVPRLVGTPFCRARAVVVHLS